MRQSSYAVLVVGLVGHALQRVLGIGPDARLSVTHGRVLVHEYESCRLGDDVLTAVVRRRAGHVLLLGDPGPLLRHVATTAVVARPQQTKERAQRSVFSRH